MIFFGFFKLRYRNTYCKIVERLSRFNSANSLTANSLLIIYDRRHGNDCKLPLLTEERAL